ncbi:MAG TPA: hypothetical protein VKB34_03240 [Povalibacter sp.]|nr:hypothetical protein [Povalibacter sp.]
MKGALQTAWLMFTCLGVQRWLNAVGAALLATGLALGHAGAPLVAMAIGTACLLLTPAFAGGMIFRGIAGARICRLIPHGRLQLLLGLLLVLILGAALFATVTALAGSRLTIGFPLLFARAAFVGTIALLATFAGAVSVLTMTCVFIGLGSLPVILPSLSRVGGIAYLFGSTSALLVVTACIWTTFGLWFLRATFITPLAVAEAGMAQGGGIVGRLKSSRSTALTTFLLGPSGIAWGAIAGLFGTALLTLLPRLTALWSGGAVRPAMADLLPLAGMVCVFGGITGFAVTRRAKQLWLRGGYSRAESFAVCETQMWRYYAASCSLVPVCFAVAIFLGKPAMSMVLLLSCAVTIGACLLYFSLMRVQPWSVADVLVAVALIAAFVFLLGALNNAWLSPAATTALLAVQALAAWLLRRTAKSRWQRIDWLIHKPRQYSAQVLQRAS